MNKKVEGDQYEAEQVVIAIFNGAGNSLLPRSSFGPHYFDLILEVTKFSSTFGLRKRKFLKCKPTFYLKFNKYNNVLIY